MNIIFVSGQLDTVRTVTLSKRHMLGLAAAVLAGVLTIACAINFVMLRYANQLHILPFLQNRVAAMQQDTQAQNESYMRDNLNAMAKRLGEMQAQLLRLDTLGERLAKLAGFKPQDFQLNERPGRGGPASSAGSRDLSFSELSREVDVLTRLVDERGDKLGALESLFTLESARKKLIPTMLPVIGGSYSSNFGWRIDPFTGQGSRHDGIDFSGAHGAPILAAAGGVVVFAEYNGQYGNMVEIEHGNGLITRYAHASRLLVKVGDMVLRGAKIAEIGSTGRSTGAHLHFEVLENGVPVNPAQFLQLPG